MGVIKGMKKTTTTGLTVFLDASDAVSYPGSGTVWYDASNNGYQCTLNGAISWASVYPASYFTLDDSSKYISLPASQLSSAVFSIEFWAYQSSQPSQAALFQSQDSSTAGSWGIGSISTAWYFDAFDGVLRPNVQSSSAPAVGAWTHIIVTRNASNLAVMYVNGVQAGSNTISTSLSSSDPRVGIDPYDATTAFQGNVAVVRYYSGYAMSAAEAAQNYSSQRMRFT